MHKNGNNANSGGSRISPRKGCQLVGETPTYDFAKFFQKMHEIKEFGPQGDTRPLHQLRSATGQYWHQRLYLVKTKNSVTKCYPSEYWTTLSSLYSHAVLILTKLSKSKHQVVSVERSMLDLESEVGWFNTHWGNILLLEFFLFSHSKASDANIDTIANFV